jgi:hypothetical protein
MLADPPLNRSVPLVVAKVTVVSAPDNAMEPPIKAPPAASPLPNVPDATQAFVEESINVKTIAPLKDTPAAHCPVKGKPTVELTDTTPDDKVIPVDKYPVATVPLEGPILTRGIDDPLVVKLLKFIVIFLTQDGIVVVKLIGADVPVLVETCAPGRTILVETPCTAAVPVPFGIVTVPDVGKFTAPPPVYDIPPIVFDVTTVPFVVGRYTVVDPAVALA